MDTWLPYYESIVFNVVGRYNHATDNHCVLKKATVVKKQRPINLELNTISFPPAAIASILHRISGVIMLVLVGLLVWLLACSLSSPEGFADAKAFIAHPLVRFVVWGFLTALGYHIIAGVRHMIMDLGFGFDKAVGQRTARFAIFLGVVWAIIAGVWLW